MASDNGSTAGLSAGPAEMNNATDGSKPAVISNGYHQRLSPSMTKTGGERGLEPAVMNFL